MENEKIFNFRKRKRSSSMQRKADLWGWLFIALPLIGTAIFTFIPILLSLWLSFTSWSGQTPLFTAKLAMLNGQTNVFANYINLFKDAHVWETFGNTLFYMLGIPIGLVLSLLLAICMNRNIAFKNGFRVIYYIPVVASVVSVALLFKNLFDPKGLINNFLGLFGIPKVYWLNPPLNKLSIVLMMTWKGLGGTILLLIAGLQGVNKTYYEAAKLDGAGTLSIFFKITFPQLMPVVFYVIVTSIIGGAQLFTEPQLFYGTDDYSTMTVVMYLYTRGMGGLRAGYASAISIILGLFIFIVTAIQFGVNRRAD